MITVLQYTAACYVKQQGLPLNIHFNCYNKDKNRR